MTPCFDFTLLSGGHRFESRVAADKMRNFIGLGTCISNRPFAILRDRYCGTGFRWLLKAREPAWRDSWQSRLSVIALHCYTYTFLPACTPPVTRCNLLAQTSCTHRCDNPLLYGRRFNFKINFRSDSPTILRCMIP